MEKTYQPKIIEPHWYDKWEKSGCFTPDNNPSAQKSPYCLMLPPPNVTGSLHMGHGFQHTLMDALIRYHQMRGFTTLWQGGTDHAGIATQLVVERQLEEKKLTRENLGREKFVEKIWDWKALSGGTISRQMRKMGVSVDWSTERFTMDKGFKHAVQTAFIKLYQDKLIYRGKRLVNWDVKLQSAVSDLEVVSTEEAGFLWHIRYPLAEPHPTQNYIIVATTRPETLFGDAAVAVNPEDPRYQSLIGQSVFIPLINKKIPVIGDFCVEPDFGTGCVKITPAHDFNDYETSKKHDLPLINILNKNGTLNHDTPYPDMDRFEARKKIIIELDKQNLLEKTEKYTLKVPRCERTGEIIEPLLTDQWYVSMKPLAQKAIEAQAQGRLKFIPGNWSKIYLQWLSDIQDWCISRQLWWGHRIPAFYDKEGNIFVGDYAHREDLQQDDDVLDTWFSAALWPFAALGWPDKTPALEKFYPTQTLVTGFDIIFFWVARMVMFGLYFTNEVPFQEVYITGLVRDQYGQKMSKSKGNVLDPIDLIDGISLPDLIQKRTAGLINPKMAAQITAHTQKEFPEGLEAFGTDALRFTFCALANTGRDIRFDLGRVAGYRNFCNKLWNAARFVLNKSSFNNINININNISEFHIFDQWIMSRLQQTIQSVHENFAQYRFDLVTQVLHDFVWHDYCGWYLEFTKIPDAKINPAILGFILSNILKLLHPVMPYITEEIFQRLHQTTSPVMIQTQAYPEYQAEFISETAFEKVNFLKKIITAIRNIRSETQISPVKKITVLLYSPDEKYHPLIQEFYSSILLLARVEKIEWTSSAVSHAALAVIDDLQLFVPLGEHVDVHAEISRLTREIQKLKTELAKSEKKLNNSAYVDKAPLEVVEKERLRLNENKAALKKLQDQLENLT